MKTRTKRPPRNSGAGIERETARRTFCGRPLMEGMTLAELRERRDLAIADGDAGLAFSLACAIDKARGLY